FAEIKKLRKNSLLISGDGSVIAALLTEDKCSDLLSLNSDFLQFKQLKNVHTTDSKTELMRYPWDFVNRNGSEIANDFKRIVKKGSDFKSNSVILKNKKNIFIGTGAVVDPFVVLDATDGPIYIGKRVRIMPNCYIQGPVFIGDDSIVKAGAAIYHNTSIGEMCKVGGEIESSIILSYSNKQHAGFLGHSYLGSWINIGAGTNNSDLKNNYENISVLLNGKPVDTGSQFVGLIMGDHSKTAINTMFNTGTIAGVSCNIFGAGFPPRYIPSFSWGGSDFLKTYDINKSLQVADLVFKRRGKTYTDEDGNLLKRLFEITSAERSRKTKA
ncbi:MAG: putative sugar nucleotidyl transferase, partial [Melioribacteraceae bacterium]